MKIEQAIHQRIETLCKKQCMTLQELQQSSGISYTAFYRVLYGETSSPYISTIEKICNGLNISLAEFFLDDLFRNLEYR